MDLFIKLHSPEELIECFALLDILDKHEFWNEDFNSPATLLREVKVT